MDILWLVAGVALLYMGGEGLVRGAAAFGQRVGLSPMVIGLTLVSIGTSSPELAATLAGIFEGAPAVSFGNVIGSNIANLGLVLGLTALIWPIKVAARFIRREVPLMILVSASVFPIIVDGGIARWEGILLVLALGVYLRSLLRSRETPDVEEEFTKAYHTAGRSMWISLLSIAVGIALLIGGAHLLIKGAVALAAELGVSERVIGLTMVALGTSLPELASCVVAAIHREGDIVLGNLIGSNIFNILFILGTTGLLRPFPVDFAAVWPDLLAMMVVSGIAWLFIRSGGKLKRIEGGLLLAFYLGYVVSLFR